jgi:hypothetical protein
MISLVFVVITPFLFLILLVWVFFPPRFSPICQQFVNLVYFFSESLLFVSLILWMAFFCLYFIDLGSYFYYFSPSVCFGFSLFLFFLEFEMQH